jgi:hypothetical protein
VAGVQDCPAITWQLGGRKIPSQVVVCPVVSPRHRQSQWRCSVLEGGTELRNNVDEPIGEDARLDFNMNTKIFLQDCKTAEFMRCDSGWTVDCDEALDFLSVRRAVSFGMKELKDSFQVVQTEPNGLPGTILIAISNLSWPEGTQSALSISLASALPKSNRISGDSLRLRMAE